MIAGQNVRFGGLTKECIFIRYHKDDSSLALVRFSIRPSVFVVAVSLLN